MSLPTVTVEIAFGNDPLDTPTGGEWTDVSRYVRFPIASRRGKGHELSRTQAGELTLRLDNRDRRFDPTFTDANLIPLQNQRDVEVALGGSQLTAVQSATVVRTTTAGQFNEGIAGLSITGHASNTFSGATVGAASGTTNVTPVAGGVTHTFGVYLKGSSTHTMILRARWLDAAGTAISNSDTPNTVVTTGFLRYTLTATAPPDAAFVRFQILYPSAGASQIMYADQLSVQVGDAATAWPCAAPYYPNVVPMRRLRVRATHNAVTYDLFTGFVEDWGQSYQGRPIANLGGAEVTVKAVDAFKAIAQAELTTYAPEVLADEPVGYWRFNEAAPETILHNEGSTADNPLSVIELTRGTLGGAGPLPGGETSVTWGVGLGNAAEQAGAVTELSVTDELTIEFWYNHTGSGSDFEAYDTGPSVYTWGLTIIGATDSWEYAFIRPNGSFETVALTSATATPGVWAHWAFTRSGSTIRAYRDGVLVDSGEAVHNVYAGASPRIRFAGGGFTTSPIAHLAVYDHPLSAERIAVHAAAAASLMVAQTAGSAIAAVLDAAGWPSGETALEDGLTTITPFDPAGTALELIQSIGEDSEGGLVFVAGDGTITFIGRDSLQARTTPAATWGDSGSELAYEDLDMRYDDTDLATSVRVSSDVGGDAVVFAPAAVTRYGPRELSVTAPRLAALEKDDRANGLLARYSAPALRVESLQAQGANDTARYVQMLGAELGDLVTVIRRPPGGGAPIDADMLIEGVEHEIRMGGWTTTFRLVPAFPIPWLLADATYGVLDSTTDLGY